VVEHLEAVWDPILVAFALQLFDFFYPVLPEGPIDLLDGAKDGLSRVGALSFREVDFLCFKEGFFNFIGPGQQANLRKALS